MQWMAPEEQWVKCNVDGSFYEQYPLIREEREC